MDAPGTIVQAATSPTWDELKHRHPACPACKYDLGGLPEPVCPECGGRWTAEQLVPAGISHAATRAWAAALAMLPVFAASVLLGQVFKSYLVAPSDERMIAEYATSTLLEVLASSPSIALLATLPRRTPRDLSSWKQALMGLAIVLGVLGNATLCALPLPFGRSCKCGTYITHHNW